MSSPVIVAGDHISPQQQSQPSEARAGCKDPFFALLFYINIIAICIVAATYGKDAFSATSTFDYTGFIYAGVVVSFFSLLLAGIALLVVMKIPETMIKASLIFVVILAGVAMVMAFASGSLYGGIFSLIFFAFSIWYARAVWSRIPFAAVNMTTAIAAIRANFGITLFAYLFPILGVFWIIIWMIAFAGVNESTYGDDGGANYGYLALLFLSFFFGEQVLENCVHVTISGLVGTWWVAPEDNGFCSGAVCNSFIRTMTTSFGSICFGSLLVAIIRTLEMLARQAREDGDAGILACIAECILSCLGDLMEYFNKWAFVYVGIYGYSYIEAGKNVIQLFKNRGWEAIIADDLVGNVVVLTSVVTGLFMGGISVALANTTTWFTGTPFEDPRIPAFFVGFIIGFGVTAILLSTIASGVNAVIVMFADAPAELERNYPEISRNMREKWMEVYPGAVQ